MTTSKQATSTSISALWLSFRRLADLCAHHFNADLRASLFSAALAVLALKVGALAILTKLSLLVVSNQALLTAPQVALNGSGPVVLYLSENQWQQRYLERAPLDRCKLAEDLGQMLAHQPRQLLVDFDLSPSLQESRAGCQQQLDQLLDQHADKLVLLMPFRVGSDTLLAQKAEWLAQRCRAGVAFGDGALNVSLGAVIDFVPESQAMADAMHERGSVEVCHQLGTADGRERWLRRGADPVTDDASAEAINFAGFSKQVVALALDDPAVQNIGNWAGRDVYFGGDYGGSKDDRFLTPMGPLPGVTIHAAIAWTQAHPVRELPHAVGVATDILTAFVFSLGIGFFWSRYLKVSLHGQGYQRENSTLLVLGFVLYFAIMLWLFFQLSVLLFMHGILIAPLLIGLSMLIDGFVRGPIAASLELSEAEQEQPRRALMAAQVMSVVLTCSVLVLLVPLLHHWSMPLQLLILTLLATLLDRVLPVLWPAPQAEHKGGHGSHADHGSHEAYPRAHLLAWLLCGALAGVAADQYLALGMGWLLAAFAGVITGLVLVLFIGLLRSLQWRSFSRPARWWTAQLLGVQHEIHGWRELAGALSFCLRHSAYWVVLVAALIVMLSH
ncbi:CHASE2 domain-containing protein [Pseudoduganella sp. FT93W]|uniref:CHASE2 domain-containing protein n=1 Tax=Duganella fentianensis TaxID=2692177 RepID=A0A845I404_9BURK|nr:CHASE2 domain-containing protein [Duganella fentianensis]MYN45628.1 CHASE2 domain-containing protein [Duganella fentianensis]